MEKNLPSRYWIYFISFSYNGCISSKIRSPVRMHPSLPGLLFWQAVSASSAMEFSLYHLGMFEKRLWVFSTPNSSWTVRILPWCHILCLANKKKKQLWCFSFENNPEKPADGWNVRDEVWLDKTSHYYDLLKGNTIVSVLEGLRRAGKYGQSKRCSIKLCSLPTAQFLSKSSDDWHQMWWGDVSPLSFYCFTISCKKH